MLVSQSFQSRCRRCRVQTEGENRADRKFTQIERCEEAVEAQQTGGVARKSARPAETRITSSNEKQTKVLMGKVNGIIEMLD